VDEGSSLVTQSGATLDQIVAAVKKVTDIVAEIAAASHEQSSGIEQVNKAVMQLDELTQQNAALVEEASAASQAMAEQARGLNERMSAYHVDGGQFAELEVEPAKFASAPAPAKAPAKAAERRKGSRPWSKPAAKSAAKAAATDGARPAPASTGTGNEAWQEF
jgi:methyl-accepting chemotaxis protein